jgi:hypothetical protein
MEGALVVVYQQAAELNYAPQEVEGSTVVPGEIASVRQAAVGLFLENQEFVNLQVCLRFPD